MRVDVTSCLPAQRTSCSVNVSEITKEPSPYGGGVYYYYYYTNSSFIQLFLLSFISLFVTPSAEIRIFDDLNYL